MKRVSKGKLKYQQTFPHCLRNNMTLDEVVNYVRSKKAVTVHGSFPTIATIKSEYAKFIKNKETNLINNRHEHKYYEDPKREKTIQSVQYQVYSLLDQLGPMNKTEIKKELGGNNDRRQLAINRLLDEGFIILTNNRNLAVAEIK
jgi:hypothetical protein